METYSNYDKIYLGRKYGTKILNAIKNAKKSIKIVSPYLSPSYLDELVKLKKKDISVTLITCDNLEEDKYGYSNFSHSDVIKQKKIIDHYAKDKRKKGIKISIIILVISIFPLIFQLFYLFFIMVAIGLIILGYYYLIKIYRYEYYSLFKLKVFDSKSGEKPYSTNLIHSKIFIIDEEIAFLGSANFTYSGFKTHYETIIKVEDKKAIKDISKEVEDLFNSTELKSKSIDKWGKEIYEK